MDEPLESSFPPTDISWLLCEGNVLASAQLATSFNERLRGLIGQRSFEGAFVIQTKWIHTIGMCFPLDIAYVNKKKTITRVDHLKPYRIGRPEPHAVLVIEAVAGSFERWQLAVGQQIDFRS
jgi:uncharacterized protein